MFTIKSTYTNEYVRSHEDLLDKNIESYIKDCINDLQSKDTTVKIEYDYREVRVFPSKRVFSVYRIDQSGWWPLNFIVEKHIFDVWYEIDKTGDVDLATKFEELKSYILSIQGSHPSKDEVIDLKFSISEFEQSGFLLDQQISDVYNSVCFDVRDCDFYSQANKDYEEINLLYVPKSQRMNHYCEIPTDN